MIVNDTSELGKLFGADGFKADNKLSFCNKITDVIVLSINTY